MVSEHFENEFVNFLLAMIKPKFAFFQMKIEGMLVQPTEAHEPRFGKGPKTFNPIGMRMFVGKFIVAVFPSEMFLVSQVCQAIVLTPAIRMNNALKLCTATNDCLKCRLEQSGTIWVYTRPLRLNRPKTMVFPLAPRPRMPLTRRGQK